MKHSKLLAAALLAAATVSSVAVSTASAADYPATKFNVVGGGSHNYTFGAVERPFWNEVLPAASGGQVTAELNGLAESGLKGPEIVRLMRSGAVDVGMGVFGFVSGDDATFEGIDLPGMAPDIETAKRIADAYRPVLEERMSKRHGIKMLATVPYTAQVFFCREPVNSLEDLKGRKIRTRGRNMADMVTALGAAPVTMAFAEVVTALQTGVIDCAVTGIGSGNAAKWYDVANNLYNLPVDWSIGFYGIGERRWQRLPESVQQLMLEQSKVLEDQLWSKTADENRYALACNTGVGECQIHQPASMKATAPTEADLAALRKVVLDIAAQWGKRCGTECTQQWNQTAGAAVGVVIPE